MVRHPCLFLFSFHFSYSVIVSSSGGGVYHGSCSQSISGMRLLEYSNAPLDFFWCCLAHPQSFLVVFVIICFTVGFFCSSVMSCCRHTSAFVSTFRPVVRVIRPTIVGICTTSVRGEPWPSASVD